LLLLPRIIGLEAAIWIGALLYLAFVHTPGETHFTICPINNLGFDFCPGCGLGNSISLIFQGEIYNSFLSHPLGLLALTVLIIRIIQLIKNNWSNYGKHITTNALS
jgi:putative copper export protein